MASNKSTQHAWCLLICDSCQVKTISSLLSPNHPFILFPSLHSTLYLFYFSSPISYSFLTQTCIPSHMTRTQFLSSCSCWILLLHLLPSFLPVNSWRGDCTCCDINLLSVRANSANYLRAMNRTLWHSLRVHFNMCAPFTLVCTHRNTHKHTQHYQ